MVDNLKLNKVAQTIQFELHSPDDFYNWLKIAIDDIVLREALPPMAFGYLIGTTQNQWRNDLHYVFTLLTARTQHAFRQGIANCLKFLKIDEQEKSANDPVKNGGKNVEQLALIYIELIREYRVGEAMRYIPPLIETRFTSSRALYDASLLTWRLMPDAEPDVDWVELFCNEKEVRFQPKYSGILALGMCVVKPSKAVYYLTEWQPLRQFFAEIPSVQDEKLREYGYRLFRATRVVLSELEVNVTRFVNVTDILKLSYDGTPLNLADRLSSDAARSCQNAQRRRVGSVNLHKFDQTNFALEDVDLEVTV